ncbi:sodium ABC transporter permease [Sulfolobales archaeon HS-7]|nr:sodium ABC transporter permease [Sulfolobales archaeon HS-7]
MIRVITSRELLDLRRDKRLILGSIILPLILLPLIGGIIVASQIYHQPVILIVNENPLNNMYVNFLASSMKSQGAVVYINNYTEEPAVKLVIPDNFYINASVLNRSVYVYEYTLISSSSSASDIANNALYKLDVNISYQRILELEHNTTIPPAKIRYPLLVVEGYVSPTGVSVSSKNEELAQLSRIISFVMFPSVTPVVLFVVDSFAGERERRTLESLLATPSRTFDLLIGKSIASGIMGILSSFAEVLGLVLFSIAVPYITGQSFAFSISFLSYVFISLLVTVFLSASLSLIVLIAIGGSVRNVQLISTLILFLGMLASFAGMLLNLTNLSFPSSLILVIPYVQIAGGIQSFATGLWQNAILYLVATAVASALIIYFASRKFDPERVLLR